MVEYLAGNRIRGTNEERLGTTKSVTDSGVSKTGLKAYYTFNESSGNIVNQATSAGSSDSLGSNADMTISGATYSQTGKVGNALSFDGSNDYGTLGSSLSQWNLFHGTGDWSINFWVNYDEFVGEDRIFSNMDSTETRGINLGVGWNGNPDGQIGLSIKSNSGFMVNSGGIDFPSDVSGTGTWVMITLVADYSDTINTYTVYLNGVEGKSQARAVTGSTGDSEYSLKLGCRGNTQDRFFDGSFDEMTIWSRALTSSEISSLYLSSPNVVEGSIFYETDNNKEFILESAGSAGTIDSVTFGYWSMTGGQTITDGGYEISAQKIANSNSELVGESIGRIDVPMKLFSGTGTVTAGVFDSSGNTLHTFGTKDISTVSTSTNPYVWYNFIGTSAYTLSVGEYVGVKLDNGSGSLSIPHRDNTSQSQPYDGSNSHWDRWNGSWSASFTNIDQNIKLYRGTPDVSDTWTEV